MIVVFYATDICHLVASLKALVYVFKYTHTYTSTYVPLCVNFLIQLPHASLVSYKPTIIWLSTTSPPHPFPNTGSHPNEHPHLKQMESSYLEACFAF